MQRAGDFGRHLHSFVVPGGQVQSARPPPGVPHVAANAETGSSARMTTLKTRRTNDLDMLHSVSRYTSIMNSRPCRARLDIDQSGIPMRAKTSD
jgi:hypothetical protein